MKHWLIRLLTVEDEEDKTHREEAARKLDSGQIALDHISERVDKLADDAQNFRESNRANHYAQRMRAAYRGN